MWWIFHQQQNGYHAYCAQHNIPSENCNLWDKMLTDFKSVNFIYIVLIFVAFIVSNISRSLRWQIFLKNLGYESHFANAFGAVSIAYMANLGIPRSGEVIRAAVLSKNENIPFDKNFGTVVLDRMVDMISYVLLTITTIIIKWHLFQQFFTEYLNLDILIKKTIPIIAMLAVVLVLFIFRKTWLKWNIVQQIITKLRGFYDGVLAIKNLDRPWAFAFHTINIWFWYYMMLYFAMKSFPITSTIDPSNILFVYVFGAMGMLVPTPGGMGSYHYLIILGLSYFGIQNVDAFSFANIAFFTAQFATNLIIGLLALAFLYFFNKNYTKPN